MENIISRGASSSGKFIIASILFEVLPQLKTAPFNGPHFAQMRQRRKADLVSNGTIRVPSFFYLLHFEGLVTKGRTFLRIDIRLYEKKNIGKRMFAVMGTLLKVKLKLTVNTSPTF